MTTKFIGVKEFRQNIAKIAEDSQRKNQRLIVLNHNTPILEVKPISEQDFTLESLKIDLEQGLNDAKAGRVYSQSKIEKMLGL